MPEHRGTTRREAWSKFAAAGWMLVFAVLAASSCAAAGGGQAPDPANATWHIGLVDVWGQGKGLDIYAAFEKGRWARALATARRFNTSIHLVRKADVTRQGDRLTGSLDILLTPDPWVPKDGQTIPMKVRIDGKLAPGDKGETRLSGTYKGVLGGQGQEQGQDQTIQGTLIGGVGPTETDWLDASWTAVLSQVHEPGGVRCPQIQIAVGVADGKVLWGRAGATWRGSPPREYPFDASGLKLDGAAVSGTFALPYRVIEPGGDPKAVAEVTFTCHRVQGLVGAQGDFVVRRQGQAAAAAFSAYGRGSAQRGAGKPDANTPKPLWRYALDTAPWYVQPAGFQPVGPGEHPRMLFRKGDVAALRRKAQTPDGKAIVARLRKLLNGRDGESLPTVFNATPPDNNFKSPKLPVGAFTTWHGAGYGMLHQLTGQAKYADLARQAVQLAFDGKMDRDNRYGWCKPGTELRAGSILTAVALAYDLCYDAWPDDFRGKVALEIQNYDKEVASGGKVSLAILAGRTGYPPSSNHYGAHMGAGAAVLAILGDPGTDGKVLTARLAEFEQNVPRILCQGFGDHGWYSEGPHPARVSSNDGLLELLTALRSAGGRDYVTPRPNAQWITLRWIMEVVPRRGRPCFPSRGVYGTEYFDGEGKSHSGDIANGFGTIDDKYKPALLWMYENFVKPDRHHYGANTYPHRAIAALVHWPVGVQPVNPEKVLPKAVADTVHGYFVSRNHWKDADDIVITNLLNIGQQGYHRVKDGGTIKIWGLGLQAQWRTGLAGATPTFYEAAADGSTVLSTVKDGKVSSLAVDLSGASGAPAMLVGVGPAFGAKDHKLAGKAGEAHTAIAEVKAGPHTFTVLTLQKGDAPQPAADGEAVKVGGQAVRFDGEKLVLKAQ